MDEENVNLQDNENQEAQQNPNPQPQQNPQEDLNQDQLTQDLEHMRNLTQDLRSTREPSLLSLATSLENSIDSLTHAHHQLNNMT